MIAESDVVHKPTDSDHNLIYCTIKSEYIQLCPSQTSPVKTEQSAGSSSGSNSSGEISNKKPTSKKQKSSGKSKRKN